MSANIDTPATPLPASSPYPEEVRELLLGDRRIVLVGTAHISQESVELVREVIQREQPDMVCVELDQRRYEVLREQRTWEASDLRDVIRKRQLATLLVNFLLASYQRRLGGKLGVMPGSELLAAVQSAEALKVPVSLCDRDVRVTVRRAWKALSLWQKSAMLSSVMSSAFDPPVIDEEELRRIRKKDVLSELLEELGRALPALKRVLIDERDGYLAQKILRSEGKRIVAVVGAGHLNGMERSLRENRELDLTELEQVPPVSPAWQLAGWAMAALVIGSIVYIGIAQGPEAAKQNAMLWFLACGIPSAIGSMIALGHPLTILAAFISAPFTSLSPLIGAGYVAAFVQAYVHPPRVLEFNTISDDILKAKLWWSNRLLRVFLVFLLTGIGSIIGTSIGSVKLFSHVL
jgi:pheromone shutdown-related protein TraB